MAPETAEQPDWLVVDGYVEAFEAARIHGPVELEGFVPPQSHPCYLRVVCEIVRVDMERRWSEGDSCGLEEYEQRFPVLFEQEESRGKLQFEYQRQQREHAREGNAARSLSDGASQIAYPCVGDEFLGFTLVVELGRGSFSRVFLARQGELAGRLVVLKVSPLPLGEAHLLAQLQHTHIVPIYSVHQQGSLQAVCMPYFGSTTLADVAQQLRGCPSAATASRTLTSTVRIRSADTLAFAHEGHVQPSSSAEPAAATVDLLSRFDQRGWLGSMLWVGARLAEALSHAHARGIHHRDLKPANVLISDDGQPMLLDFNLSQDVKRDDAVARFGGTLPYMAPEQLEALLEGRVLADPRSDLYSLGMILKELIEGSSPPASTGADWRSAAETLLRDRRQPPGRVVSRWIEVPPAVESMLVRCLAPNAKDRYQTAEELREDIERQLSDLPLKHAPNPSRIERLQKWRRRHRRLTSIASVVLLSSVLLAVIASIAVVGRRQLLDARRTIAHNEAQRWFQFFQSEKQAIEVLPGLQIPGYDHRADALQRGHALLRTLGLQDSERWRCEGVAARLGDDSQALLQHEVGELAFLMSRLTDQRVEESSAADQNRLRRSATQLRALSRSCLGTRDLEDFLSAADFATTGKYKSAADAARTAIQTDPQRYSAWFLLANCEYHVGNYAQAVDYYSTAVALRPDLHWAYFNRGLCNLARGAAHQATEDFSHVLRLQPQLPAALVNRALARESAGDLPGALQDLTAALQQNVPYTRVYLLRSRVLGELGREPEAQADLERGLSLEPTDELSWVARGQARLPGDPQQALADFQQARGLNPRSRPAWQNEAHVLAEYLARPDEAVQALDRLLAWDPDFLPALGGRGVLLARLGRCEAAIVDAQGCLALSDEPFTKYQVACIYALCSAQVPQHRGAALRLLAQSLRADSELLSLAASDADLSSLREDPEYQQVLSAAQQLHGVEVSTPSTSEMSAAQP